MIENINLKEIINNKNAFLGRCIHFNDNFLSTWQCSHIRVVSAAFGRDIKIENFLAWIFQNDPSCPEQKVGEWLPNCSIESRSKNEIEEVINRALKDFEQEKGNRSRTMDSDMQFPIRDSMLDQYEWGYEISSRSNSGLMHTGGPTQIVIWKSRSNEDWFHYLKIYNES